MLELLCYTLALVLLTLAAVGPNALPYRDRLVAAGLAFWVLPLFVHAVQAH